MDADQQALELLRRITKGIEDCANALEDIADHLRIIDDLQEDISDAT